MKKIIAILLLSISVSALADGYGGALGGLGDALSNIGNQMQQQQNAEEQIRRNEQIEIAREQRMYDAELKLHRQQEEYARQDADRRRAEQDRANEIYHQQQTQIVAMHHPDWEKITASKEFADWKVTLPLAIKNTLSSTWDGAYISEAITAFKEHEARNKKHHNKSNAS